VSDNSDIAVFLLILTLRLVVPLFIPRFPLPAVIAAMLLDAADQTIFQRFTDLSLDHYQGYDKALDVYYLTIAYLSTMRNWENLVAFNVSRFLLYYRFIGVLLFEYTDKRWLLMVFPNTFEYFFIWYEAVRLRWDPARMPRRLVIGAAAFIWIVIKLPQEYWIHVAQLDFTNTVENHPWFGVLCVVGVIAIIVIAYWVITRKCPPADHKPSLAVDEPEYRPIARPADVPYWQRILDHSVLEKIALISLVSVIFAQILPEVEASGWEVALAVAFLIIANAAVSEGLSRRGVGWTSTIQTFFATAAINAGVVLVAVLLLPRNEDSIHVGNALFFLLLLTLIVTLYDRFRPFYLARVAQDGREPAPEAGNP